MYRPDIQLPDIDNSVKLSFWLLYDHLSLPADKSKNRVCPFTHPVPMANFIPWEALNDRFHAKEARTSFAFFR
jgi:hypothetical protein